MSDYQKVKDFVFDKLRKKNTDEINIPMEIEKAKRILNVPEMHDEVFDSEGIQLSESDWRRMQKELETSFNVKMERGILIKGKEQQNRDTKWWTSKSQQQSESYYWDRYKEYLEYSLPPEVVKTIHKDTDIVMNNIENPNMNQFDRRGMVVGHVQSGKTGNYAGLICKAADAGYKFIIVIAGGTNNLRDQTQERLNNAFVGKDGGKKVGAGFSKVNTQDNKMPVSLTTKEKDFDKRDADRNAQGLNFEVIRTPIILVIKKNVNTLRSVIAWLNKQYPNRVKDHAMLMIDDESDYASIDTSKAENEPTAINKGIRKILAKFNKRIYVAYTATPYANIFIDHQSEHRQYEDDLFPRDFIYALNAPDNYFGARKIFLDSGRKYLIPVDDYQDVIPAKHKKDLELPYIPNSLYEAMRVFFFNIAIRNLRGQTNHNSMLIHATQFTAVHQGLGGKVSQYIEKSQKEITAYGKLDDANSQSELIRDLENTFNTRYSNSEFTWQQVLSKLCSVVGTVVCREVHQERSVPLEYRNDIATNAIVIGGTSLSRGYTLEGLSVSYFLRNTVFYDTLMQMGRWFGYREGYQDLCKIYMSETMIDNFGHIIEATEELFIDFKRMSDEKMTPKDFGLAVRSHPDSILQVTARNKQRDTQDIYFEMKLDGHSKETSYLYSDLDKRNKNINAIKGIVAEISKPMIDNKNKKGNKYLWRDVNKEKIINFLNDFKVVSLDPIGLKTRMPIDFIKKYADEQNTDWDVALYSGVGSEYEVIDGICINKEKRKVTNKGQYYELQNRQVSSEGAELIVLSNEQKHNLKSKRKDARAIMSKPLLMLHILEPYNANDVKELAAFGISFPGGVKSSGKTIKFKINSVYIKEILQGEQSDD